MKIDIEKDEAYAIAEFIDFYFYQAIRDNPDIDSMRWAKNVIHVYEKFCKASGYVGTTEESSGNTEKDNGTFDDNDEDNSNNDEETDGDIDDGKICSLYLANWPIAEIVDELKCSTKTIYAALNRHGIQKRKRW